MLMRLVRFALLTLAALGAPALAQQPARIVAVGDLHGDYFAWLDIARGARLIDPNGRWAGGRTILVQLGDVTDRGPDSLKIIRSLQQLAKQAPRSGGKVVVLLGNHEAMNLLGDLRYTTPGEFAAFVDGGSAARRDKAWDRNRLAIEAAYRAKTPTMTGAAIRAAWYQATALGWAEHQLAWQPNGALGRWAGNNPAVIKLGDTLFAHGGLSAEYATLTLDAINRRAREAMAAADDSPKSILNDPLGPLWYRGLVSADPEAAAARAPRIASTPEQELTTVLAAYGARRIVVGHTPKLSGIAQRSGGRLIQVDTGISRFYGGPLTWLEIAGDRVTPHTVPRSAP
ncbi:MAG TPA: metallophosphoesterase [Sphingomicrobium sp.]